MVFTPSSSSRPFAQSFSYSIAISPASGVSSIGGFGTDDCLSFKGSDFPYFLYSFDSYVQGVVVYEFPDPQLFITDVKDSYFSEIESFVIAAVGVLLVSLLLRSLLS